MKYEKLEHFLSAYLSVEETSDLSRAIRTYAREEGEPTLRALQQELRALFASGAPIEELRRLFEGKGHFELGDDPTIARSLLIDLFEHAKAVSFPPANEKPYDVFISHSSIDKEAATRLAVDLKERGYAVWLDKWEILVGHNIVDQVFRGITESEFLVVVLSPASCQSKWVQEELTTAKISEIEQREVTILPVRLEPCDIPVSLKNKRYADFAESWDEGLRELTTAIDLHRASASVRRPTSETVRPEAFRLLGELRNKLIPIIQEAGFTPNKAFKDVIIGPPDHVQINVDKARLASLVEACRIQLRGGGGVSFPYEAFPKTQEIRLPNGIRYIDTDPWPYRSWSFHFWQIDTDLRLFHRDDLSEDHVLDESGQSFILGKLAHSWALMDIVLPLRFAHNLLRHEKQLGSMAVKFAWGGMRDRALVQISRRRWGFRKDYRCHEGEWVHQSVLNLDTDLLVEARNASLGLFWLFGWDPAPDALSTLDRDLETLLGGVLPS